MVTVSDGNGGVTTVTVPVTVTPVNDAPVASAPPATTAEDTPVSGAITASDVDGDTLSFATTTPPAHGTVTVDPATGAYTYTPDPNYAGPDSFVVTVSDGNGGVTTVTVPVTVTPVNDAPTATGGDVSTSVDTPVSGHVDGSDVDGDPLNYAIDTGPAHGSVTIGPDGAYVYRPAPGYVGADSFTVQVSDGHGGVTTVTVNVTVSTANEDGPHDTQPHFPDLPHDRSQPGGGGIDEPLIVISTVNGIGDLRGMAGIGIDGVVLNAVNGIRSLNSLEERDLRQDGRPSIFNEMWSDERAFDPRNFLGHSASFDLSGDGGLDIRLATIRRPDSIAIMLVERQNAFGGGEALTYSLSMADGSPAPAWLQRVGPAMFVGRPPADLQTLDLVVSIGLRNGEVLERSVVVDVLTGHVTDKGQTPGDGAKAPGAALFSDQLRKLDAQQARLRAVEAALGL
ncbi:MAG: tandem-95 repeat protein [Rhizobiales bacterium]|nr:tandem-95 repeat protein [Hyphomicrobiales bacterium]